MGTQLIGRRSEKTLKKKRNEGNRCNMGRVLGDATSLEGAEGVSRVGRWMQRVWTAALSQREWV